MNQATAIAIRPEEKTKKVLVKTDPTYPNTKDLGNGHNVSVMDNHSGGKVVPFLCYAISSHDPDLEWFDLETEERLPIYIPPVELERRHEEARSNDLLTEMVNTNRLLVLAMSGGEIDEKIKEQLLKQMGLTPNTSDTSDISIVQQTVMDEHRKKANEILSSDWRKRQQMVQSESDVLVLTALSEFLGKREKLGKTDEAVLLVANQKISEMKPQVEGKDFIVEEMDDSDGLEQVNSIQGVFVQTNPAHIQALNALEAI